MALYQKYLTETDVARRLVLPVAWLRVLPAIEEGSHQVEFEVTDGLGFFWEFCCSIRRTGQHPKPVLQSEGWLKFVNHKGLKVRDKIILDSEVNDFRGTQIRIRAQKLNTEGNQWIDV